MIKVPDEGNDVALAIVKLVTDALIPEANVDKNVPEAVPPH